MISLPAISVAKQQKFLGAIFFCLAYFPNYKKYTYQDSNPERFIGVFAFIRLISSSKETALYRRKFSVLFGFQATLTALRGKQTPENLPRF